jgi:hypothetical protein
MNEYEYIKHLENELKRIRRNIMLRDSKKIIGAFINGDTIEEISKYFDLVPKELYNFLVEKNVINVDQDNDEVFEMDF